MTKRRSKTTTSGSAPGSESGISGGRQKNTYAPGRVTLSGIRKEFEEVTAVKDASISIKDGEFVTLVGPSGCGKTTTLRMIAGFEKPTSGTVGIAGLDVTRKQPNQRNVGMVFQDFALFEHMTVADNIAYGLEVDGRFDRETIDKRVEEMLELVELPEYGNRMPDQLSGGQQQRIALARSLAKQPDVLLLDEPLASLDKQLRESMQVELRRIQREVGITTILVTHNQREALTMSDRIAVMRDGTFEQVGAPEEIYEEPATTFVADFVGTANVIDARVTALQDDLVTLEYAGKTIDISNEDTPLEPDDAVSLVIRPENVVIETIPETTTGPSFRGTVDIERYTGDKIEYHIETDDGGTMVSVEDPISSQFEPGDEVCVTLPPEDCLVRPGRLEQ